MKLSFVLISILSLIFIQTTNAQSKMKKDSVKLRQAVMDSLNKQTVPFTQLKEKYKDLRKNRSVIICPVETIILENGARATFQTSDNKRIKSILSKLFSVSPVDFILSIRGIEGLITIKTTRLSWVKREDLSQLMKLVNVDVVTPQINQEDPMDVGLPRPSKLLYLRTPMGINALSLINSYLDGLFPSVTSSYESVKTWLDSGKSKEEYKFEPFTPYIKEPDHSHKSGVLR